MTRNLARQAYALLDLNQAVTLNKCGKPGTPWPNSKKQCNRAPGSACCRAAGSICSTPRPFDIEIEDIAHGLARVARWNGQTYGDHAFSVAQHCMLVEDIVAQLKPGIAQRWRLAALLHDAPEYVVGDLISPFKAAVGLDYKSLENKLLVGDPLAFRFARPFAGGHHRADQARRQGVRLFRGNATGGLRPRKRRSNFSARRAALPPVKLMPLPAAKAQREFVERFKSLLPCGERAAKGDAACPRSMSARKAKCPTPRDNSARRI